MAEPPTPLRPLPAAADAWPATRIPDARLVALVRAACAPKAALRRPFLRGRWRASHLGRVAAATAELALRRGEVAAPDRAGFEAFLAERLAVLLDRAPTVADGLNSLAEYLGGRASSHPDRLVLLPEPRPDPPKITAAAPAQAGTPAPVQGREIQRNPERPPLATAPGPRNMGTPEIRPASHGRCGA